jgi:hypothetical protein
MGRARQCERTRSLELPPMIDQEVAVAQAMASIHEESFSLESLTVFELESLRDKINTTIFKKLETEVPFYNFEYNPIDPDRNMGDLRFEAKTKYGILQFQGYIGLDGGLQDSSSWLHVDGKEDVTNVAFELLAFFHSDTGEERVKIECAKAILDWVKDYE